MRGHPGRFVAVVCVLVFTGVFASVALGAQQEGLSEQDKTFMKEAASGGLMEVKLGEMASTKAESDEVKEFGKLMVKDHSAVNKELEKLAQDKKLELPKEMNKEHQQNVDRLSKLSGAEFDREYMALMVKDHQSDIEKYQKEGKDGQDADVKALAAKTVPTLQEHLNRAREIQGSLKK